MKEFTQDELEFAKEHRPLNQTVLFDGLLREELEVLIEALEKYTGKDSVHEKYRKMCLETLRYRLAAQFLV